MNFVEEIISYYLALESIKLKIYWGFIWLIRI